MGQVVLRCASAAVIALGFCSLHFFGLLSVEYYAEPESEFTCDRIFETLSDSPNAWTDHQLIIVAISILVPTLAFYLSNVINQELIMAYEVASKSNAIVRTLFPEQVRSRMLGNDHQKTAFQKYLAEDGNDLESSHRKDGSKPIADVYPETTIMFADLAGFTSWSSGRDPTDVFVLLETIYEAYDRISKHYGIFKVETSKLCVRFVSFRR